MPYPIKNIIVVMLENRSYDNLLGWLYSGNNPPPYNQAPPGQSTLNGLNGTESNPVVPGDPTKGTVQIFQSPDTITPEVDPGELFRYMAQQVYGLDGLPETNPYANCPPAKAAFAMQGFVVNYAGLPNVNSGNQGDCMTYLTPQQIPVTSFLARNFAVCDQWYASVPCQTLTNRVFSVCAAPGIAPDFTTSFVDDTEYALNNSMNGSIADISSIFSQLDQVYGVSAAGPPNWKVYFHDYSITALTVPYVYNAAISSSNVNVTTYDNSDWAAGTPYPDKLVPPGLGNNQPLGAVPSTFLDDLANGTLPMFSLIEPRYANNVAAISNPPNSNHPGASNYPVLRSSNTAPIDVTNGEAFLAEIYNTLIGTKYWNTSLLIITYDEHGGLYDHVPPPAALSPGTASTPGGPRLIPGAYYGLGFGYGYFGCRVPAIAVSPYIVSGSMLVPTGSWPFDHASIVRTVWDCFQLGSGSLTQRDATAPSVMAYLTETDGNNPGPCPTVGSRK